MRRIAIGNGVVIEADCRSVLDEWDQCDALVFDPGFSSDEFDWRPRGLWSDVIVLTTCYSVDRSIGGWQLPFRSVMVWDTVTTWRGAHRPLERSRLALWMGEGMYQTCGSHLSAECDQGRHLASVFRWPKPRKRSDHPHEKPLEWMRCMIANCTRGVVADPFAGSGSTVLACIQLGRPFVAIERDPVMVDSIVEAAQEMIEKGDLPK